MRSRINIHKRKVGKEMLSKVLNKSTCADCRFCCSFRRCSLWETPLFPEDVMKRLKEAGSIARFKCKTVNGKKYGMMDLLYKYKTDDTEEEAACEFLDSSTGCTLSGDDKPFDCKIWPLRIMESPEGQLVIALTPTCPAINKVPFSEMEQLVNEGLGQEIYEYAEEHPYIVKEYREDFPVLMKFGKK
jgi:hypothetical protein